MSTITTPKQDQIDILRVEDAQKAARSKHMSTNVWSKPGEIRVYLRRQNADRTEAGYISLYWGEDGKAKSGLRDLPQSGPGSRTAAAEAESVYSAYLALRKARTAK